MSRSSRHLAPALSYLPFSLDDVVESVRQTYFAQLRGPIPAVMSTYNCLACCWTTEHPLIHIHHVLNHPQTPREVIEFICKHELLHFVIPPDVTSKRMKFHTPAFCKEERRIAPESRLVWAWLHYNLGECLRDRPRLERVDVTPEWRRLELSPRSEWWWRDVPTMGQKGVEGQEANFEELR